MTSMEQSIIEDMSDWDQNMIGGDDQIEIFDIPKQNQSGGASEGSESVDPEASEGSESVDPEANDSSQKSEKEDVDELPTSGEIDLGFGDEDEDSDAES